MITGLDPSNSTFGVAILDTERAGPHVEPPRIAGFGSVPMHGSASALGSATRVVSLVDRHATVPGVVRLEIPPETAKGDVNHGGQAALGWALGWVSGIVADRLHLAGHAIEPIEVSPWRDSMFVWSARWGHVAEPPGKHAPVPAHLGDVAQGRTQAGMVERTTTGLVYAWAGCGHKTPFKLTDIARFPYRRCPKCSEVPMRVRGQDPAEWRRQAWKALACALVRIHWPESYDLLVVDARSRARTEKADHELVGVADACEAVWIAVSALEAL